ncbi:MAG: aldo/keto reductase [Sphingobacteriales bacterium]|nr:MAG: aldo/keto reductase [Sphingobacteriales bacterium]
MFWWHVKISLGTVQFGLNYGISNQFGQVGINEASTILKTASEYGVNTLDTAAAYGESEKVLGTIGLKNWVVGTKLPSVPDQIVNIREWVITQFKSSLDRLGVNQVESVLLHNPSQLMDGARGKEIYKALLALKNLGMAKKIGISIYNPEELSSILKLMKFDLVQAPYNLFDQRIVKSGWSDELERLNVELHVRSIFLQGLLLFPPNARPERFSKWQNLWEVLDQLLKLHDLTPLEACVQFAMSAPKISRVVVGVQSQIQLQEILQIASRNFPILHADALQSSDLNLINPANWR